VLELTAKTNSGSFDDPRGLGANTLDVRFSSPISINEIVFAARREPVAKRVVVDVAYDVMAKGFKVQEESENPRPEWTRQVSKILDELDTKEKLRELVKLGTTIVEDVGSIDNSPPERVPHEEYVGKDLAKTRLLMPLKLSRLEQRVGDIEKKLTDLSDIVSELVSVLKTAFIPKSPEDHSSQPVEDRRYIS